MPAAIPAIGIFFAGIGSTVTFGLATGIGASLIGGALVGAAIGGLTSLVTGGSLGKGLLFGALGGAVMGGLSGLAIPTTGLVPVGEAATSVGAFGAEGLTWGAPGAAASGGGAFSGGSAGMGAAYGAGTGGGLTAGEGMMYGMAASSLVEGGLGMAGSMLEGAGQQSMYEDQQKFQEEQAAAERALREKLAEMEAGIAEGGLSLEGEKLSETIREFDKELAQRQKEHDEMLSYRYAELERPYTEAREDRQRAGAALEGINFQKAGAKPNSPSIYEQIVNRNSEVERTA